MSLKQIVHSNTMNVEKQVITNTPKHTDGNKAKAARLIKIDYKIIHSKVKQFEIPNF